ncbi:MAG TPA: hypothetical protein VHV26_03750 [Rhizomicrobium sp.]|nr:hypothetical protein [Rhizomicrobium sp.]
MRKLFSDPSAYDTWAPRWRERLAQEAQAPEARRTLMRSVNPMFIPRNHRIEARSATLSSVDLMHSRN